MFSLKEVGLFIYYPLTSAMDSVWTLMYYRYDLRTHQLSHDEILQSYIAFFVLLFYFLAICCCISLNAMFSILHLINPLI